MSNDKFRSVLKQVDDGTFSKTEIVLNDCDINNADVKKLLAAIYKNNKLKKRLKKLVISKNNALTKIDINGLSGLEELKIDKNGLIDLSLKGMDNLKVLLLNENNFEYFDFNKIKVDVLKKFDISKNKLNSFRICRPIDIELLDISENPITTLFFNGRENISRIKFCKNALKTKLGIIMCRNIIAQKLYGMYIDDVHEMIEESKESLSAWVKGLDEKKLKEYFDEHINHILSVEGKHSFEEIVLILKNLILLKNLKQSRLTKKIKSDMNVSLENLSDKELTYVFEKAFMESLTKRLHDEENNLEKIFTSLFPEFKEKICETNILCKKKNTRKEKYRKLNGWPVFYKLYEKEIQKCVQEMGHKIKEPLKNKNKFVVKKIEENVENIGVESNLGREFVKMMYKNKPHKR